jgi:CRP/FNR family cyclic AMP-dependent transcriptional regulator
VFIDMAARLAKTLLELSVVATLPGEICLAQREIAQITGLSREMTNKQLRLWARKGWIRLARKEIVILKPAEFSKIVSC